MSLVNAFKINDSICISYIYSPNFNLKTCVTVRDYSSCMDMINIIRFGILTIYKNASKTG